MPTTFGVVCHTIARTKDSLLCAPQHTRCSFSRTESAQQRNQHARRPRHTPHTHIIMITLRLREPSSFSYSPMTLRHFSSSVDSSLSFLDGAWSDMTAPKCCCAGAARGMMAERSLTLLCTSLSLPLPPPLCLSRSLARYRGEISSLGSAARNKRTNQGGRRSEDDRGIYMSTTTSPTTSSISLSPHLRTHCCSRAAAGSMSSSLVRLRNSGAMLSIDAFTFVRPSSSCRVDRLYISSSSSCVFPGTRRAPIART